MADTFKIYFDEPVELNFYNDAPRTFRPHKVDAITGAMLQGATFEVIKTSGETSGTNGTTICTVTTDVSGVIVVTGLEAGTYAVKEIQAPDNYLISETNLQTVNLKADGTSIVEVLFNNYPYGNLLITKTDGITGEPLANARFKVTNGDGQMAGTSFEYETDSTGKVLISNLKPDSYVITEIQSPSGYTIDGAIQSIDVINNDEVYTLTFRNYPNSS